MGYAIPFAIAQQSVTAIVVSSDERLLAVADKEGIQIWNLVTDMLIHTIPLHSDPHDNSVQVQCLAFSSDSRLLASGLRSFTSENSDNIKIWDVASGQEQQSLPEPRAVTALAFSPNGQTLISCNADATVNVWQAINP